MSDVKAFKQETKPALRIYACAYITLYNYALIVKYNFRVLTNHGYSWIYCGY